MGCSTNEDDDRVLTSVHVVSRPPAEVDKLLEDGILEVVTAAPGPPHETVCPLVTAVVHSPTALNIELGREFGSAELEVKRVEPRIGVIDTDEALAEPKPWVVELRRITERYDDD